jgi:transcriptional regulator with XRE-family HTH domain
MAQRNRIRVARAEKRKTQIWTAQRVGMQASKLSLIENGYVEPTPGERAALARVLGVAETELFPDAVAS